MLEFQQFHYNMLVRESLILEKENLEYSAGLVIIQNNTILLGHPTDAKWWGSYSFPKGHIEEDESILDAAIRETEEEVDITIFPEEISDEDPEVINYVNKDGDIIKKVYYFVAYPEEVITSEMINPDGAEIDWAGFLTKNKASQRINKRFKEILDVLEDEDEDEDEDEEK